MKIFNFNNSVNFKKNEEIKPEERIDNIEEFEKKFDIDKRTVEYCKRQLANWEKCDKRSFDEKVGDVSTIEFEKRPSEISNHFVGSQLLVSNLALLRQKQAIMNYSALYDSKGYMHDDWISDIE